MVLKSWKAGMSMHATLHADCCSRQHAAGKVQIPVVAMVARAGKGLQHQVEVCFRDYLSLLSYVAAEVVQVLVLLVLHSVGHQQTCVVVGLR